ncbi:hypothetical protein WOLCODRAFT_151747 [Wolfiporia cocos MD-104 SS10]|uniref:Uncharacterized protein n=1 Tax=Wolfiporia cocos (strain MD-104) TaxID=742152 RepID=A0A2H3JJH4_WOLCO|nr:hypothetical protein WOLCODRAFT_151747 [Wolfiporia cocos MD-104 SS10]
MDASTAITIPAWHPASLLSQQEATHNATAALTGAPIAQPRPPPPPYNRPRHLRKTGTTCFHQPDASTQRRQPEIQSRNYGLPTRPLSHPPTTPPTQDPSIEGKTTNSAVWGRSLQDQHRWMLHIKHNRSPTFNVTTAPYGTSLRRTSSLVPTRRHLPW